MSAVQAASSTGPTRHAAALCVAMAAALAAVAGCGPAPSPDRGGTGEVSIAVVAGAGGPALTRVHVEALPAGAAADLALDGATSRWSGTLTVQAGVAQTLTATAFAGSEAVGTGDVTVSVAQHETAAVMITILDGSGRPAGADHGPIIAAVTAAAAPVYRAPVELAVEAVDPDADVLEYAWSASCAGAFSAPSARVSDWTPDTIGPCTVAAEVRSGGVVTSGALALTVAAPRPELTIEEDTAYPFANDPRSTYPYRIDSPEYATLGTTATTVFGTTPDRHVRLVRYVVSNAGVLEAAIDAIYLPGAWSLHEYWELESPPVLGGESAIGTTCPSLAGEPYVLTPVCAVGEVYPGPLGPESGDGLCEPALDAPATLTQGAAAATGRAVTLDGSGVEGGVAPKLGVRTLVPAASGGMPGRIALYLARPLVNSASPGTWTGSAWTLEQRVWSKTWAPPDPVDCPEGWPGEWDATWDLYLRPQSLVRADDELLGTFVLNASAVKDGAVVGPATTMATVDFSRFIEH